MLRLWYLEFWLCATLNLFGLINYIMANDTYEFTIDLDEQGEPVITHKTLAGVDGGFGGLDTLRLHPNIAIAPTEASYSFMERMYDKLHAYLIAGACGTPRQFYFIEFADNEDNSILQACVEEFIKLAVCESASLDDLKFHLLTRPFVIDGATWVVSKDQHAECSEYTILDASRYPIVKVSEKIPTPRLPDLTNVERHQAMTQERWVDFDYLQSHFPLFS